MRSARQLAADLAAAELRLDSLPLAHQVDVPAIVACKRAALVAHVDSLREQLSTALVHEAARPVENSQDVCTSGTTTTRVTGGAEAPSSTAAAR